MNWLGEAVTVLVVVTILGSLAVVHRLDRNHRRWRDVLQSRFLYGVPWGTLVVLGFVLAMYLFVQDGITEFDNPVVKPFRAWSFFYPLGMVTAPFAHASASHLTGNLIGTIVIAPIAEYAWGHYAGGARDREPNTSSGLVGLAKRILFHNPLIRAFVVFPGAVIAVGLLTGLFAIGPVIGFSGVVFAFAGFAIVRYPIVTLIAAIGIQGAISTIYRALQVPIGVYVSQPQPPSAPSWATIAIQGHALGFFLGLVLAIVVFRRREYRPDPLALWLAVLLYAFSKSLWAIYWFGGANRYILFQGPGIIVVVALAMILTVAVSGSQQALIPPWLAHRFSRPTTPTVAKDGLLDRTFGNRLRASAGRDYTPPQTATRIDRVYDLVANPTTRVPSILRTTSQRYAAFVVVVVVLAAITGPAIPVNLFVLGADDGSHGDVALSVEDYTVTYAEDAQNPIASAVDAPGFEPGGLEASGVIVSSSERNIWIEAVSAQRLAFSGSSTIYVGGPGWREPITAEREGWTPVGNDTVYQIWLENGDDRHLAYTSPSSQAQAQIDGKTVTISAENGTFVLEIDGNQTSAVEPNSVELPEAGESVSTQGLEFVRVDGELFVTAGDTTVQIAQKETYT